MLEHIHLKNFRNHTDIRLEIPKKGLIITGKNGSGKTSILEAIYMLATLKSFRAKKVLHYIEIGNNMTEISAETSSDSYTFRWQIKPQKKSAFFLNDILLSTSEVLKKKSLFAVLFSPEDLFLCSAPPDLRRRYMNRVLVPLFPNHLFSLRNFEKILKSRNALLKRISEGLAKIEELDFYDEKLSKESQKITEKRAEFFEKIKHEISKKYSEISDSFDPLLAKFIPSTTEPIIDMYQKNREKDVLRKSTSYGAHLDDFSFSLRKNLIQENASRGEMRSAILALKIAESIYIESVTKKKPILLLDDVFSELDADRRKHLAEMVSKMQTIITATDTPTRAVKKSDFTVFSLTM